MNISICGATTVVEVFSTDLSAQAQQDLIEAIGAHNYDVFPLVTLEFEKED